MGDFTSRSQAGGRAPVSRLRARCPLKVCSASAARAPAPATCARGAQACDAQADSRHVAQGLPGLGAAWHNARSTRATHLAHATAVPGDLGVFEQGLRCPPVPWHGILCIVPIVAVLVVTPLVRLALWLLRRMGSYGALRACCSAAKAAALRGGRRRRPEGPRHRREHCTGGSVPWDRVPASGRPSSPYTRPHRAEEGHSSASEK